MHFSVNQTNALNETPLSSLKIWPKATSQAKAIVNIKEKAIQSQRMLGRKFNLADDS